MYRNLYFGQKKSIYHKLFPWAWMMIPLSSCCCCICVCYNIHLWWLYNMLENYKLHHPCNDNTRTMQKQCFFLSNTNFSCMCYAHMLHSLKNEIINLTDVGKDGSATESHNSWSCRVFRGCWPQVSDSYLTSFLLQTWNDRFHAS